MDWSEAVSKGMVYNAVDGCKKMNCTAAALDSKHWCKLQKGKNLIKVRLSSIYNVPTLNITL